MDSRSEVKPETQSTISATTLNEPDLKDARPENGSLSLSQESGNEKIENSGAPHEVTWDGDVDPENPRNWRKVKKW
jgi:hypothetical protein